MTLKVIVNNISTIFSNLSQKILNLGHGKRWKCWELIIISRSHNSFFHFDIYSRKLSSELVFFMIIVFFIQSKVIFWIMITWIHMDYHYCRIFTNQDGVLNFKFVSCIFAIAFEINIAAKKLKGFLQLQCNPRISQVKHFITRCQLNRLLNDGIDESLTFSSKITAIFKNYANDFQKVIIIFTRKRLKFDSGDENKILPILRNTSS